jgi:large subunit ribosomal protein L18
MDPIKKKRRDLKRRHRRVRRKISGTAARPRLSIYRSLAHMYGQIIDDEAGKTLVQASTHSPEIKGEHAYGGNCKAAAALGELLARKAGDQSIESVVFDRGGRKFHGRIKALADGARKGGLKF